jgi:ubiquinone biosynthesis protein COQ9
MSKLAKADPQDALVLATLPHVAFDGWTFAALKAGGSAIGMDDDAVRLTFPDGGPEAIRHFIDMADRMMVEDVKARDLSDMKLRDKVTLAVRLRLERWSPYREAVRRALPAAVLRNPVRGAAALYRTVDAIWRAIGDRSVDFNFYTKRALLGAVYGSTLLYWLDDRSEGCSATWTFLARRIADVMKFPKLQQGLRDRLSKLPNPLQVLRGT